MKRTLVSMLLWAVLCGGVGLGQAQAQIIGRSQVEYNGNNSLGGYSATELWDLDSDYWYDPYVECYIYDQNGNFLSGTWTDGGSSWIAAAQASAGTSPGQTYYVIGEHYVIAAFQSYGCFSYGCGYYWNDPFGFSFLPGGEYGGSYGFYGSGSYSYIYYDYIYLGRTGVQAQTADPTPQITGISPSDWVPGTTVNVTISGTGFGANPTVQVDGYGVSAGVLSASNTQIVASFTIATDADPGAHNVTVTSNGLSGNGFLAGDTGASPTSNGTHFSVTYPALQRAPNQINASTGDPASAHGIQVEFSPPNSRVTMEFDSQLQSNYGGSATATLTMPSVTTTSPARSTLKAGPDRSNASGEFYVRARIRRGPAGPYGLRVVVPPQIILQMMRNEARAFGSDPIIQTYLAWAFRNRFGDRTYFGNLQTYEANIKEDATYDASLVTGAQPELDRAAAVFVGQTADPTGGSQGFWSPTNEQWTQVQTLLSSGTTQMPDRSTTGISFFYNGDRTITQIVYFPSVPRNNQPGYEQAPSFLFIRKRSADAPAAVEMARTAFNRIDETPVFVQQHYLDFLNRQPDQEGWGSWTEVITACGTDAACIDAERVHVSKSFFFSAEFIGNNPVLAESNRGTPSYNREFVRQCYLAYLRREPDQSGWDFWTSNLNDPGPGQNDYDHIIRAFLVSGDYRARFAQ